MTAAADLLNATDVHSQGRRPQPFSVESKATGRKRSAAEDQLVGTEHSVFSIDGIVSDEDRSLTQYPALPSSTAPPPNQIRKRQKKPEDEVSRQQVSAGTYGQEANAMAEWACRVLLGLRCPGGNLKD